MPMKYPGMFEMKKGGIQTEDFDKIRAYPWDKKSRQKCAKIVLKKTQKDRNR